MNTKYFVQVLFGFLGIQRVAAVVVWRYRASALSLLRFTSCLSFYSILNELNDYAGQREVVAEEMAHKVYGELMRYSQDLKAERKHVSRRAAANRFGSVTENLRPSAF